jgi:hypothetical protein
MAFGCISLGFPAHDLRLNTPANSNLVYAHHIKNHEPLGINNAQVGTHISNKKPEQVVWPILYFKNQENMQATVNLYLIRFH